MAIKAFAKHTSRCDTILVVSHSFRIFRFMFALRYRWICKVLKVKTQTSEDGKEKEVAVRTVVLNTGHLVTVVSVTLEA